MTIKSKNESATESSSTQTMRVDLKEIPSEFQRSIETNLRAARAAGQPEKAPRK